MGQIPCPDTAEMKTFSLQNIKKKKKRCLWSFRKKMSDSLFSRIAPASLFKIFII